MVTLTSLTYNCMVLETSTFSHICWHICNFSYINVRENRMYNQEWIILTEGQAVPASYKTPSCDSYVVNSGKSFSVIEERKHLRKNEKIHYHFRNGYFVTVSQIYIHCIYNFRQLLYKQTNRITIVMELPLLVIIFHNFETKYGRLITRKIEISPHGVTSNVWCIRAFLRNFYPITLVIS